MKHSLKFTHSLAMKKYFFSAHLILKDRYFILTDDKYYGFQKLDLQI